MSIDFDILSPNTNTIANYHTSSKEVKEKINNAVKEGLKEGMKGGINGAVNQLVKSYTGVDNGGTVVNAFL
jgi:hypothetical protein